MERPYDDTVLPLQSDSRGVRNRVEIDSQEDIFVFPHYEGKSQCHIVSQSPEQPHRENVQVAICCRVQSQSKASKIRVLETVGGIWILP